MPNTNVNTPKPEKKSMHVERERRPTDVPNVPSPEDDFYINDDELEQNERVQQELRQSIHRF